MKTAFTDSEWHRVPAANPEPVTVDYLEPKGQNQDSPYH